MSRNSLSVALGPAYFGTAILAGLLAAFAGTVSVLNVVVGLLGGNTVGLEPHLALVIVGTDRAVTDGEALWVAAALLVGAVYRWFEQGFEIDTGVILGPLAVAIIVTSGLYARAAGNARTDRHGLALAEAVRQADRKHVREVVFACKVFCGFIKDPGALVWLTDQAQERADMNAIGQALQMGANRNARSRWLPDHRTPIEVAVDRYAARPHLLSYVLGIDSSNYHFVVPRATAEQLTAAVDYALARKAAPELIERLLQSGAKPTAEQTPTLQDRQP